MTADELNASMLAKGFVRQPDGSYARSPSAGNQRRNSELQKQQDGDSQSAERQTLGPSLADYQAGISATDERDNGQYRITIKVRFSTRRRTDLSGKLDTILDCLIAARRRCLGIHTGNQDNRRTVRAWARGRNRDNRAAVKGPLPF